MNPTAFQSKWSPFLPAGWPQTASLDRTTPLWPSHPPQKGFLPREWRRGSGQTYVRLPPSFPPPARNWAVPRRPRANTGSASGRSVFRPLCHRQKSAENEAYKSCSAASDSLWHCKLFALSWPTGFELVASRLEVCLFCYVNPSTTGPFNTLSCIAISILHVLQAARCSLRSKYYEITCTSS